MRLRHERRVRKRLRTMCGRESMLAMTVAKLERRGYSLPESLCVVLLDPARCHYERAAAGKLLGITGDDTAVQALLGLFFEQDKKDDVYATALTLEELNDLRSASQL